MVASWMPLYADRQTVRERRSQNENREARDQERGDREEKRMKKAAETAVPGTPINFPPFRKRPKKKEEPKPEIN